MNLTLLKIALSLFSLLILTNCTKNEDILPYQNEELPNIIQGETNPAGNLDLRGQINELLLKESPKLSYTKTGNKYYFSCQYPTIQDKNPGNYFWICKWSYKLERLGGVKFYYNQYLPPLVPVDFLSCGIEVYCENKITGIKSNTKSTLLIVKL